MDPMTLIGLAIVLITTFLSMTMGGINFVGVFFSSPDSIILVLGGTIGATIASGTKKDAVNAAKVMTKALTGGNNTDPVQTVQQMVNFADRARRDGLLALEEDAKKIEDPFLQKGIQLAIDGTDPDVVREILETEIDAVTARHKSGYGFFSTAVGFAPAFGVAGTVIGLINMLNNLTDPSALGPAIALAFITTLWGVFLANYIFGPIANKLKKLSADELAYRELVLEGILSIQAGANPRSVADRLKPYLAPAERDGLDEDRKAS